ncbi:MAG TPA: 1,2-phenylacetyl-CoA epoxidase subunit PaaD [Candidatus Limnocylindrales bacterium]|nr:1,2-phenylacetyl-CoA epoxidase subunit PaaD [Candidatus Limnocylindrales bacterium]
MSEPVPRPLESAVWAALADVPDPEIPTVSVVDLGVVHRVEAERGRIRVELLPTFVGCPAVEAMRRGVEERLAGMAAQVEVVTTFRVPWTSDRITAEGRERLRGSGFAPPVKAVTADSAPALLPLLPSAICPHCGSHRTTLENAFGPTLCRSIHHCSDCRQPFEQFKTV